MSSLVEARGSHTDWLHEWGDRWHCVERARERVDVQPRWHKRSRPEQSDIVKDFQFNMNNLSSLNSHITVFAASHLVSAHSHPSGLFKLKREDIAVHTKDVL